jgi:uncharacterized cupin superfamily protein
LPVRPGDVIANPPGAEALQIVDIGKDELRHLAVSDIGAVDIIDYPYIIDYPASGKIGGAPALKNGDLSTATYKAFGHSTTISMAKSPPRRLRTPGSDSR